MSICKNKISNSVMSKMNTYIIKRYRKFVFRKFCYGWVCCSSSRISLPRLFSKRNDC